jgi:hypothetical protein
MQQGGGSQEHAGPSVGTLDLLERWILAGTLETKTLAGWPKAADRRTAALPFPRSFPPAQPHHTMHSVPAADLSDWDDYEINLDQRILDPEICICVRSACVCVCESACYSIQD